MVGGYDAAQPASELLQQARCNQTLLLVFVFHVCVCVLRSVPLCMCFWAGTGYLSFWVVFVCSVLEPCVVHGPFCG